MPQAKSVLNTVNIGLMRCNHSCNIGDLLPLLSCEFGRISEVRASTRASMSELQQYDTGNETSCLRVSCCCLERSGRYFYLGVTSTGKCGRPQLLLKL